MWIDQGKISSFLQSLFEYQIKSESRGKMECDEMNNFIKVWLSALVSLSYCYVMSKIISKGPKRLIFFLPIMCLFIFLPLKLNYINLVGATGFFLSWLANFKLLLLAFNKGPLASNPPISFGRFIVIASFPIEIRENNTTINQNKQNPFQKNLKPTINFTVKTLLLAILIRVCDDKDQINPNVLLVLYSFAVYLILETILVIVATLVRVMAGLELEPQFNEPFLSTSLQDFWGRRWNLMVTRILRPTVFEPTLRFSSTLLGLNYKWAALPAVMATFVVSGLVHELIYFYMARTSPTWEVTSFFVLHGLCLTVEIVLKRALSDRWRLPRLVSGALTIGFVMLTSFWLFFPQLLRCKADVRTLQEYINLGKLLGKMVSQSYHFLTKFHSQQ
ncbi:acyl-CoA--sterol O-acyltransferase 1-like [Humulus lupulus]|uniref:acyl-CoA--sterol O-acyltransferase 1-like n=1 Tax=Humulus lupulus TaxID=3486 RepID=UPI002B407058|nr:acyl-CoA--sterol O-acyltransferase 1-like [Humulus lupulus]